MYLNPPPGKIGRRRRLQCRLRLDDHVPDIFVPNRKENGVPILRARIGGKRTKVIGIIHNIEGFLYVLVKLAFKFGESHMRKLHSVLLFTSFLAKGKSAQGPLFLPVLPLCLLRALPVGVGTPHKNENTINSEQPKEND
jgi:hypothetical protein